MTTTRTTPRSGEDPVRALRRRSDGYDSFGLDPAFQARLAPTLDRLLDDVFALDISGLEHVPSSGRAVLVGNHAGAFPWDALVLARALARTVGRTPRALLEDQVMTAPFIGSFLNKLGCVRASQENAMRLLANDELIAVFPEGNLGLAKLYRHRYELVRFGRGGFVKLAHRTNAPILPVTILGAEDTAPLLTKVRVLFRGTLVSYLPVTPLFPALGPLGLLPLPARWSIRIGPPIDVRRLVDDIDDSVRVTEIASNIRADLQRDLDALREARGETWRIKPPWR